VGAIMKFMIEPGDPLLHSAMGNDELFADQEAETSMLVDTPK